MGKSRGDELRDLGIKQSIDNANENIENWSELAYAFLVSYIQTNGEFMVEDVRAASLNIVPTPPSNRAWGGIVVKAARENLITRKGFKNVKNSKAHSTPATLWQSLIIVE
jgi:hypothetical protein